MSVNKGCNAREPQQSCFLGSIVVNLALIYVAHHVIEWQIGWVTPAWSDVLWAVDLTLEVSIVANVLYLAFDSGWFRNATGAVSAGVALLAIWWLGVTYPFDFGADGANDIARLILLLVLIGTGIATLVMAILAMVEFV